MTGIPELGSGAMVVAGPSVSRHRQEPDDALVVEATLPRDTIVARIAATPPGGRAPCGLLPPLSGSPREELP